MLVQADAFQAGTSATYDEPLYTQLGREVFYHHTFRGLIRPMDPPIPVVVPQVPAAIVAGTADPPESELPRLTRVGRFSHAALIGVPVVLVVYGWLLRRKGWWAATLGGAMVALSPTAVAFAAIASTDMSFALFGLIGVAGLARYYAKPSWRRYFLAAIVSGLALAAKQSAAFLFPCFLLLDWHAGWRAGRSLLRAGLAAVGRTVGVVLIAFLINWAAYAFTVAPIMSAEAKNETFVKLLGNGPRAEDIRHVLQTFPVPASLVTFFGQLAHGMRGHSAYFLGEVSDHGWRAYYPVAILVKATPADLVLLGVGMGLVLARARTADTTIRTWVLAVGVFLATCITSKLDLGVRYLAVVYPLGILIAVDAAASLPGRWRQRALLVVTGLVGWQAASAAAAWPTGHLSYFNSLAGGPANGHRYLADSNLDWGQGLPALAGVMRDRGYDRVAIAYFGTAPPTVYGVESSPWDTADPRALNGCQAVAVSVSYLCGVDYGRQMFAEFRDLTPDAKAGESIWVYDLTRPEVRAALTDARRQAGKVPFLTP
jgi:4-amino-4-deoxy-L-arabinose transferase-like glycosyltransferase